MAYSPATVNLTQKLLLQLRTQQYSALMSQPINWNRVEQLGKRILALEIHRSKKSDDDEEKELETVETNPHSLAEMID